MDPWPLSEKLRLTLHRVRLIFLGTMPCRAGGLSDEAQRRDDVHHQPLGSFSGKSEKNMGNSDLLVVNRS